MQRNLRTAAAQFREAFDSEIVRAVISLQVGPQTAQEGRVRPLHRSLRHMAEYRGTPPGRCGHLPARRRIAACGFGDGTPRATLRSSAMARMAWHAGVRSSSRSSRNSKAGQPNRRSVFRDEESLIVTPLRNRVGPNVLPAPRATDDHAGVRLHDHPARTWTTCRSRCSRRWRSRLLHDIQRGRHVPGRRIVAGQPLARCFPSRISARRSIRHRRRHRCSSAQRRAAFFFGRPRPALDGDDRRAGASSGPDDGLAEPRACTRAATEEPRAAGVLLVQHQSGSLETAVASVRRRNLGISFGMLLLLTVSVGAARGDLAARAPSRRQQMEFVAGVTHELRTPVAVDPFRRRKPVARRGRQMIASSATAAASRREARRLGEMSRACCSTPASNRAPDFGTPCRCRRPTSSKARRPVAVGARCR